MLPPAASAQALQEAGCTGIVEAACVRARVDCGGPYRTAPGSAVEFTSFDNCV